uniref:PDZ domain-containing protein n=1 Tax=Haemonchus contortus TaxID=6289 RepID=A0A7I5E632_HAECO
MYDSIPCSSALSMRSRPFSAYSNLCSVEENEDVVESQLIDWQIHFDDDHCELEVEIHRETSHPGGLAFRIIGSRSSGIFVSYVDGKSQQAALLQEGDLIKECNGKNMSGITCEQAASILRFSLSHNVTLSLRIIRKGSGPLLMAKRRTLTQISQEQEKHIRSADAVREELSRYSQSRLRQSTSCPDYRPSCSVPVKATVFNKKLLRKVASVDEEIELLMENEEQPVAESTIVTSVPDQKSRCCICSRRIRAKRIHMMSHRWVAASLSLLPMRRARSAFHCNSYSLV